VGFVDAEEARVTGSQLVADAEALARDGADDRQIRYDAS